MPRKISFQAHPLRPGGTISGPSMFALADLAPYVAVLAQIGPAGLAVTTNIDMNLPRKPEPRDLVAECRLLKLGKRRAAGTVLIASAGSAPVAPPAGLIPCRRTHLRYHDTSFSKALIPQENTCPNSNIYR